MEDVLIDATLVAAGISPERCGEERTARLNDAELELYKQVLHAFAASGRPSPVWVRERATALGFDADQVLAVLAREDLIHLGADGEIAVAYPFSGRPTRHQVTIGGDREVWSMCAIDALGMAAMLGEPIEVRSSDPVSSEPVTITLDPGGKPKWDPAGAMVIAGTKCECIGPSYQGCCDVLNFFASQSNAEHYLAANPQVQGHPITIPEAADAGYAIVGDVLHPRA